MFICEVGPQTVNHVEETDLMFYILNFNIYSVKEKLQPSENWSVNSHKTKILNQNVIEYSSKSIFSLLLLEDFCLFFNISLSSSACCHEFKRLQQLCIFSKHFEEFIFLTSD